MEPVSEAHALLSASGSHRWATCAGSLRMEKGLPRTSSKYAAEGTAAHTLGAWCLQEQKHPKDYPDRTIDADGMTFQVNAEMIAAVEAYVARVHTYVTPGSTLLVEQKVCYASWLGLKPEQAFGTSDAVVLQPDRIVIVDLKYGMGVKVDAEDNEQLNLYALGALYEYEMICDPKEVTVVICQPRSGNWSEHTVDVTSLKTFALNMKAAALKALNHYESDALPALEHFTPHEDACRWCGAKAKCPALLAEVETETRDFFARFAEGAPQEGVLAEGSTDVKTLAFPEVPEDQLAQAMSKVGLIEDFCKAVRAETERRLLAGQDVAGWKLVEGRRGPRDWSSKEDAEAQLKAMRLKVDEMYDLKVKSPTSIEKVLKESPRKWAKLQSLITQSDGKPSVAPDSDKRPALRLGSSVNEAMSMLASADDLV